MFTMNTPPEYGLSPGLHRYGCLVPLLKPYGCRDHSANTFENMMNRSHVATFTARMDRLRKRERPSPQRHVCVPHNYDMQLEAHPMIVACQWNRSSWDTGPACVKA